MGYNLFLVTDFLLDLSLHYLYSAYWGYIFQALNFVNFFLCI